MASWLIKNVLLVAYKTDLVLNWELIKIKFELNVNFEWVRWAWVGGDQCNRTHKTEDEFLCFLNFQMCLMTFYGDIVSNIIMN